MRVGVRVRYATDVEMDKAAEVWHSGLGMEEGSPWADYLRRWTPGTASRWFLDSSRRLGARFIVAEKEGGIVGVNGMVPEKRSGVGRFLTGVVVVPEARRMGVGSAILHKSLSVLKREGLRYAEVETRSGITASKYLYPKYGGIEIIVGH